jgi:hypothetical protein
MPAPFVDDEPIPPPPMRRTSGGVPLAAVAGGLAILLLLAGIAVGVLWKGAPPIVARPALDAQGKETLHLTCDACTNGTRVTLGTSTAEFASKEADLPLSTPLTIGDNALTLHVERPGMGRDEDVKIVVPVLFRIRADMSSVSATPPVILVKVEASSGSEVQIDGVPVALDANGAGSYAIDIHAETEGQSLETKRIEKKLPYVVTRKGAEPTKGTLPAAVGIVALALESPGMHAITDQKSFVVAGQTKAGGAVTVNGEPVAVDGTGAFAKSIDAPAPGDVKVDVVATAPQLAARTVHFVVKRVSSVEAEAKALEAAPALTYDAARDIGAHVGERIVVEGEIIETRLVGHQTILVLTDRRGCAAKADPNQCLARVLFGGEDKRKRGDHVRVFGRITRAVTAQNGRSVPEIEAELLAKPRGG